MLTRSEAAHIIALAWDRYRERKYQELEDEHLAQWEYMNENPMYADDDDTWEYMNENPMYADDDDTGEYM